MADDSDQLQFDIGADNSGFVAALGDTFSKASSMFGKMEDRGKQAASVLNLAFGKVGGSASFSLLNHGLQLAERNGSKLAGTLLKVQSAANGVKGAAMGKVMDAELALLRKVQSSGGLTSFASSLGDTARTAVVTGVGAFAGFEALKFGLNEVIEAAKVAEAELGRLVKIGDDSKSLGVGTTFFQRFTDGSKKLGLEADDLTKILQSLKDAATVSLGTGDDINPTSSAQDAIAAHIAAGNLKKGDNQAFDAGNTQEERLKAALDLVSKLKNEGKQLAELDLAGKLFGADFAGKLREDDGLLDRLRQKVADIAAGKGANVIPPEQIAAAKEMDAQIEELNHRVSDALLPYHRDIAGWQQEELRSTLAIKETWTEIVEVFGTIWGWCDKIKHSVDSWNIGNAQVFKDLVSSMDRFGLIDKDISAQLHGPTRPPPGADTSTDAPTLTVTRRKTDTSRPLPVDHKATKEKDDSDDDKIENLIKELNKAKTAEEAQASAIGLGNKAKQEAIDLDKLENAAADEGRAATAEETKQVIAAADAYTAAKDRIEAFNRAQEQAKERATFFGNEFESSIEKVVMGTGKLSDVLTSVVKSLEQAALKALILGQGPLAGLFGTASGTTTGAGAVGGLFGGLTHMLGFAGGGEISGPGSGTSDSILAKVSAGEFVVNAKAAQANLPLLHALNGGKLPAFANGGQVGAISTPSFSGSGSAAGGHSLTINQGDVHVNATGGTPAQNADLAKQIRAEMEALTRGTVVKEIRSQMRSGNLLEGFGRR